MSFILPIVFLLSLASCRKGPVPVTADDNSTPVYHVDTILFSSNESVMVGDIWIASQETGTQKLKHLLLGIITVILICVMAVIVGNRLRVRRLQRILKEYDSALRELKNRSGDTSSAVLELIKERVSMVKALTETHLQNKRQLNAFSYQDKLDALQSEVSSYNAYLEDLRRDTFFFGKLEAALNAGDNNIMAMARSSLGASVSEMDYLILSCLFAGMNPASIGFVTGIAPGTIRTKKSRIKARIKKMPSSAEKAALLFRLENPFE